MAPVSLGVWEPASLRLQEQGPVPDLDPVGLERWLQKGMNFSMTKEKGPKKQNCGSP